jgi:hypothetical protein
MLRRAHEEAKALGQARVARRLKLALTRLDAWTKGNYTNLIFNSVSGGDLN